jgi:hypothetical protein
MRQLGRLSPFKGADGSEWAPCYRESVHLVGDFRIMQHHLKKPPISRPYCICLFLAGGTFLPVIGAIGGLIALNRVRTWREADGRAVSLVLVVGAVILAGLGAVVHANSIAVLLVAAMIPSLGGAAVLARSTKRYPTGKADWRSLDRLSVAWVLVGSVTPPLLGTAAAYVLIANSPRWQRRTKARAALTMVLSWVVLTLVATEARMSTVVAVIVSTFLASVAAAVVLIASDSSQRSVVSSLSSDDRVS